MRHTPHCPASLNRYRIGRFPCTCGAVYAPTRTFSTRRLGLGLIGLAGVVWVSWPWVLGVPITLQWEQPESPQPITRYEVCLNNDPRCTELTLEQVEGATLRATAPRVRPGAYEVGVRACWPNVCSDVTRSRVEVGVRWAGWRWVKVVNPGP